MSDDKKNVLGQLKDELQLQAWLARAEFSHPSLKHEEAREEVGQLAALRDEFRVQMHLGRLEAADRWEELEASWRKVKSLASKGADDAGSQIQGALERIRKGYRELRGDDA